LKRILFIFGAYLFFAFPSLSQTEKLQIPVSQLQGISKQQFDACTKQEGAIWRTFSGGCKDNCGTESTGCTAALEDGCDCGKDRCFDQTTLACAAGKSFEDSLPR
jgi:hypothetical protein